MANFEELKSMKNTYAIIKKKSKEHRIAFLDSIVSYCEFIKFSKEQTLMMLALIRNVLPQPGQSFSDCDVYDGIDEEYNKKINSDNNGEVFDGMD